MSYLQRTCEVSNMNICRAMNGTYSVPTIPIPNIYRGVSYCVRQQCLFRYIKIAKAFSNNYPLTNRIGSTGLRRVNEQYGKSSASGIKSYLIQSVRPRGRSVPCRNAYSATVILRDALCDVSIFKFPPIKIFVNAPNIFGNNTCIFVNTVS
jgi:hypothetical protein